MNTFPLFSQLPVDIRRLIWLATVGTLTLRFTKFKPEDTEGPGRVFQPLVFANYTRHYGHVVLADGSSRLNYAVEPNAAYLACRESHSLLRHVFAELVGRGGGLPSWFRFDADVIRVKDVDMHLIANHAWFTQTEHLIIAIVYDNFSYMGMDVDEDTELHVKDHHWITTNLVSLKDITFHTLSATTYTSEGCAGHWLQQWWDIFEQWYNCKWGTEPVPFYVRVVSYDYGIPEEEWLTPTNYLCVKKLVLQKHIQTYFADGDCGGFLQARYKSILEATDEELSSPTAFFNEHRERWDE